MDTWMKNEQALRHRVAEKLAQNRTEPKQPGQELGKLSAVLCLMGYHGAAGPYLVLTKRSAEVPQPGDLSFPGGRLHPRRDALFSKLLALPQMPLARWPYRKDLARNRPLRYRVLTHYLATSLRESFEEIRLIPLNVAFLGSLQPQPLVMFQWTIIPMVGWLKKNTQFKPNREVARIIPITLQDLLNPENYATYHVRYKPPVAARLQQEFGDFPCFVHHQKPRREILWGATFRIVMALLEQVFDFTPPDPKGLPVINGRIGKSYYRGQSRTPA